MVSIVFHDVIGGVFLGVLMFWYSFMAINFHALVCGVVGAVVAGVSFRS